MHRNKSTQLRLIFHTNTLPPPQKKSREKTISSTNGVGKKGYPHVEDWTYISTSHHVQKSI
jgi:hypothetical protein